ncbi:MAG: hypothetical protein HRT93_05920 [Piscirickettsiaceae bacterium]|nr:hypothetical protein [Piscirickettsiaceae bacterium]
MINETIKRWVILASLLLLTLWLVWNTPQSDSDTVIVKPTLIAEKISVAQAKSLRDDIKNDNVLALLQRQSFKGKSVDLFDTPVNKQQQIKKMSNIKPVVKPVAKRPTAPPLPFKYIGKLIENDVIKVFLLQGEALHIVSEGDIVDKHYQLKDIDGEQLRWLYLPLNITQNMNIGKTP